MWDYDADNVTEAWSVEDEAEEFCCDVDDVDGCPNDLRWNDPKCFGQKLVFECQ